MQGIRGVECAVLAALATLLVVVASSASDVAGDPEAGAETYTTVCKGCHGVSIAPTLRGVIGRPIAGVTTFAGYSDALKAKSSMTWTEANLDAFLTAPATFAPGTLMTQTIPEAQRRADLIAYLATLPPPR
jgi:cytochrome c